MGERVALSYSFSASEDPLDLPFMRMKKEGLVMQSLMRLTKWIGNFEAIRAPFMKSHLIVSIGLPENDFDAHNVV